MRPGESAKYNSQELDKETNYYFYNARHYDPEICRFVTADNLVDNDLDTQGWNRYSYVKNNPIIYKDPTGHISLKEIGSELLAGAKESVQGYVDAGKGIVEAVKSPIATAKKAYNAVTADPAGVAKNAVMSYAKATCPMLKFTDQAERVITSDRPFKELGKQTTDNAIDAVATYTGVKAAQGIGKAANLLKGSGEIAESVSNVVKINKHHTVPKEILKGLPENVRTDPLVRGRAGAPNRWPIPEDVHKLIHKGPGGGAYNESFKGALESLKREATSSDVLKIRDNLVKQFGIEKYRP